MPPAAVTAQTPGQGPWSQPLPTPRSAVNRQLTRRRRGRVTENDEYGAFARRVIHAWARRVAAGDIDAIGDMAAAARELDDAMRRAVTGLRAKDYSWAEIATRLGITRQAAQQRWGRKGRRLAPLRQFPRSADRYRGDPVPHKTVHRVPRPAASRPRSAYAAAAPAQPGGGSGEAPPGLPGMRNRLCGGVLG